MLQLCVVLFCTSTGRKNEFPNVGNLKDRAKFHVLYFSKTAFHNYLALSSMGNTKFPTNFLQLGNFTFRVVKCLHVHVIIILSYYRLANMAMLLMLNCSFAMEQILTIRTSLETPLSTWPPPTDRYQQNRTPLY